MIRLYIFTDNPILNLHVILKASIYFLSQQFQSCFTSIHSFNMKSSLTSNMSFLTLYSTILGICYDFPNTTLLSISPSQYYPGSIRPSLLFNNSLFFLLSWLQSTDDISPYSIHYLSSSFSSFTSHQPFHNSFIQHSKYQINYGFSCNSTRCCRLSSMFKIHLSIFIIITLFIFFLQKQFSIYSFSSPLGYKPIIPQQCPYYQGAKTFAQSKTGVSSRFVELPRDQYHEFRIQTLNQLGKPPTSHTTCPLTFLESAEGKPQTFIGGFDALKTASF